jgi:hypothetical protein
MRVTSSTAIFAAFLAASAPSLAKEVLPFIADDYPKVLALARAEKKRIFLEAWAPW